MRALTTLTKDAQPERGEGTLRGLLGAGGGWKSRLLRYGLAAGTFVLLLLFSAGVRRLTGYNFDPTSLVIITMIASAWYLGLGPGLLLALLFEAVISYFSPPQLRSIFITFNRMILFASVVSLASWGRRALRERERLLAREREARAEAEAANRLKDEFLATVSHELRTPLTAILGWAAMLTRGAVAGEAARNALEVIERNARAQAGIVNDILDVSRVITGKLHIDARPADLVPVVRAAVGSLHPAAVAKSIDVTVALDPSAGPVSGDPDRLQQVVWNLLSNAVKFTPAGGRVEVRLARVGAHVELSVQDDGIGIGEGFLPHVFERFRQADSSTTRAQGGLGLGLSIVRHLAELHGGTVRAESAGVGKGSTFTLRLPAAGARDVPRVAGAGVEGGGPGGASAAAPRVLSAAMDLTGLRVLVVDDEPDTLEILCAALNRHGANVRAAASSRDALDAFAGWEFDVLVSDLGMPNEDGYELIGKVRALAPGRGGDIPAAALTAYVREEDRLRALAAGFQLHIPKPVDPDAFAAAVAGLAKRGQGE